MTFNYSYSNVGINNKFTKQFALRKIRLEAMHEQLRSSINSARYFHEQISNEYVKVIELNIMRQKIENAKAVELQYFTLKKQRMGSQRLSAGKCQEKINIFYPEDYGQWKAKGKEKKGLPSSQTEAIRPQQQQSSLVPPQSESQLLIKIGGGKQNKQNSQKSQINSKQASQQEQEQRQFVQKDYELKNEFIIEILQQNQEDYYMVKQLFHDILRNQYIKSFAENGDIRFRLELFYFRYIKRYGLPFRIIIQCPKDNNNKFAQFQKWLSNYKQEIVVEKYSDSETSIFKKYWSSDESDCNYQ